MKYITRARCHSKANEAYNKILKQMVDKMTVNLDPHKATKVWVDESGKINTKVVNLFKSIR